MKTIQQQATIDFHAVDNKSLIQMVPLMDYIVSAINVLREQAEWRDSAKTDERKYMREYSLKLEQLERAYAVLSEIGFCSETEPIDNFGYTKNLDYTKNLNYTKN